VTTATACPSRWPCGTPKSTGNAFNWRGQGSHIVATTPSLRATASGKGHTKSPPLQIKAKPNATVHGLSHKSDALTATFRANQAVAQGRHGGAYSRATATKASSTNPKKGSAT